MGNMFIKKRSVKYIALIAIIFSIGWVACIGFLNYTYHYNFVNSKSGDVLSFVDKLHQKECLSENNYNIFSSKWRYIDSSTFYNESFSCLESKSRKLGAHLILMSIGYEQMDCVLKADEINNKEEHEKCIEKANKEINMVKRELTTGNFHEVH